ncbi:MAG: helix-turn-helix transcriptional regulator [Limisphaerales bacterium]
MLANLVKQHRERRDVSKAHLARQIGVSRAYVTRLEGGQLQPSGEMMFRIAGYFKCPIEAVFHIVELTENLPARPSSSLAADKGLIVVKLNGDGRGVSGRVVCQKEI